MKRLLLALFLVLIMASTSWAVGTATVTNAEKIKVLGDQQRVVITITWTDDTAGTTLAIAPNTYGIMGWYLVQAETNPGTTAPTDNYDITLVSTGGIDIGCAKLMNRDETNTERVSVSSATLVYPMVIDSFTFTLSGNAVNGATGTLKLIFSAN